MLKFFRHKNVAKVVLWGILILILPAFVLWGVGNVGRSKDKGPSCVGVINGKKVSFENFAGALSSTRCQVLLNYFNQPKLLDTIFANKAFVGRLSWDRLILASEARRHRINVSDKEVINYIRSHPIFLRNGKFDDRIYEYFLKHNVGLDPRSFEEIVRENLAIQKMNDILTKDIKVTDEEVLEAYRKGSEKFKLSYILWATDAFLDKIKIDDKEAEEYYEKFKNDFTIPSKDPKEAPKISAFADVKESIKSFLAGQEAKTIAAKQANEDYNKIKELMAKEALTFEASCARLGLKTGQTPFFSKSDYLEGIGEARTLADIAVRLKKDEISEPTNTRKGNLVFKVADIQKFDEEKFKKEKDEFAKKVLAEKKNQLLELLMARLESKAALNIELKDYDKYYR